ncbi:hypothetical protein HaLaN_24010 [Haematococcus lacustris]|uniref:Uncharacterized protein n=1 Tax=Haematococcus lacustris TaxID=44745 RepID=A0A699ZVJ4_HAELA|nr:hypothetical protein HaLaN_24010 [Haematococcus lacustris]
MLRLLVRTAAVGADGYNALVLLLDGAPDYKAETRLLSGVKPQQLAPLALDLVWGMEGILQMMQQHWRMFCLVACEGAGSLGG